MEICCVLSPPLFPQPSPLERTAKPCAGFLCRCPCSSQFSPTCRIQCQGRAALQGSLLRAGTCPTSHPGHTWEGQPFPRHPLSRGTPKSSPKWEQSCHKTQGCVTLYYAMHNSAYHNILRQENKPGALPSLSGFSIKQIFLG